MKQEDIGKIIRNKRIERGIKIKELAEMTNLSAAYLSRIERGERKAPSYNVMEKIFTALGIPLDKEENRGFEADFFKLKELLIMHRNKGNMSIRETIEILELIEDIIKGKNEE
ncbi:helix-turn-helix protein [Keratinibaculum paraultunense]|uniref:Helix-turn-helix protein n=1 Tax=Keratinibaculum paraultunense TaxID=1278232 RepID=A0A4R3KQV0_9FIRM|nr:helix-turn-helix transcriptional regulator [Keratinibaculum paraultunense]QQY79725.1 helix-turn-helix transcriptional regulator [Keratinibaculum paraultunense]TCS86967.1 helix-turn-helix protein [Keratinibaculum paraultunense]